MLFQDLVNHTIKHDKPVISFEFLRKKVADHHPGVGSVMVYGINYPIPNGQAYYRLGEKQRTSPYDDEFNDVSIAFCKALTENPKELRYKLTKELAHVFDANPTQANSKEKFKTLLKEIQNKPVEETASPMYKSDPPTRWKAAILLCPKKFRDQYKTEWDLKNVEDYELAEIFQVPEWIIPWVMDDYFDEVYKLYVG